MPTSNPIVVIGGGTAGCTVVSQLASATTKDIVLIEPGTLSEYDDVPQFLSVLSSSHVDTSTLVTLVDGGDLQPYTQARSLGGGSAVNGMLLTGEPPESVAELTSVPDESVMGPVSGALVSNGGRISRLWWNGGRWNPGRAVQHLIDGGRVQHDRAHVEQIAFGKAGVGDVHTSDSASYTPSNIVMCAGALTTPALLLPMKIGKINSSIGLGLQNHPTITFVLRLRQQADIVFDCSAVMNHVASNGGRLMTTAYERASNTDAAHGLLTVSLMNPVSRGAVWMSDEGVRYDFNMLAHDHDKIGLREGVRWLLDMVRSPSFLTVSDAVFVDDMGTGTAVIDAMKNQELDAWIRENLTLVSHAASSCGQAVDETGALRGVPKVHLADASALASVPFETPAASVTMEALRISRMLAGEYS